jgi:putative hydrolase of the HAD superfamily
MELELIGFDADDTLWHNERLYRMVRERFNQLMSGYHVDQTFDERVDLIETANLAFYGYGAMGFILSLIEAGIELTQGQFSSKDVRALIELGKEMLGAKVQLFDHAEKTIASLSKRCPLMLITKGDLNHQLAKVDHSGLASYFKYIEVVHDKTEAIYRSVLEKANVNPAHFVMVGNSLRSDILPVIDIGGWAIYIPNDMTWSHEQTHIQDQHLPRFFQVSKLEELEHLFESLIPTKI